MEEKLNKLFSECVEELRTININIIENSIIGEIDIKIAKRNCKRYGCCKHEKPDESNYIITRKGYKRIKTYNRFYIHHIEISKWVMDLDEQIIKNTIMHEIIHCFPYCNNHGAEFKKYSNYINQKLGYNISRVGNKQEDYKKSNIEYNEYIENNIKYNYKVVCSNCGQTFYRQRIQKNFTRKYKCGKCGCKFIVKSL